MATLLDKLRTLSTVDCDTLDAEGAAKHGPFVDCTSNQAIAFSELSRVDADGKPLYHQLMLESLQAAHGLFNKQTDATLEELAVELMMVGLSLRMAPHTTGYLHVQTNPKLSYSTQKTVKNAERIVSHFKQLSPDFDSRRVCIKIPSTWEGLQACRELEKKGIATLATTLFSLEQTALAADAGCRYIAPYVNELRVHFDPSYNPPPPNLTLPPTAQQYLTTTTTTTNRTLVLAASFTSPSQVLTLAGTHHLTLSPPLLTALAATPAAAEWATTDPTPASSSSTPTAIPAALNKTDEYRTILQDESLWRMAFTRAEGGEAERKLVQALNIFADVQDEMEGMVRRRVEGAGG